MAPPKRRDVPMRGRKAISRTLRTAARALLAGTLMLALAEPAQAQDLAVLRLNTFPNATNLALHMGIANGVFEKRGITIDLRFTQNSEAQRNGLAKGEFEIAYSAVDNAVAMVELAKQDVIIIAGGDGSMNEFMTRPDIRSLADMRGKTLVVDRPNTAYALQGKKILKNAGLLEGRDYAVRSVGFTPSRIEAIEKGTDNAAAGMLNPPYSFAAKDKGLKSFGRVIDLMGPYQGGGIFVMREWARANGPLLERFLAAYVEATRMALAPANRVEAIALIAARLKQDPAVAERTYDEALTKPGGLAPDAKFDLEGFKAVLQLRAEIEGQWSGKPPAPERYIDLSHYARALKLLTK
jgi:ABC-type nitrate/sulfonate/bicarbonate transport system substrate-binding protein